MFTVYACVCMCGRVQDLVALEYPCPESNNDCYTVFSNVVGDFELVCNTNYVLHAAVALGKAVYAYDFNVNPQWVEVELMRFC